jgi:thiamine kinase-like enzyme
VTAWPADVRRRLRQLWADHDRLTAIAGAAERTLCHLDVWPANLVDDDGTTVLLDWSFTGDGAVGEDVANLIIDRPALRRRDQKHRHRREVTSFTLIAT